MPHELDEKNTRCPVAEFERRLIAARVMTRQDIKTMNESIDVEITQAFTFARESPLPDKKSLHNHVDCE